MADRKKVRKLANQLVGDILLRRHPSEHTEGCARRSTWVPPFCDVFIIICWALVASLHLFLFQKGWPQTTGAAANPRAIWRLSGWAGPDRSRKYSAPP